MTSQGRRVVALRRVVLGYVASRLLGGRSGFLDSNLACEDTKPQGPKDKKHVREVSDHQLKPSKPAAQDSSPKKSSNWAKTFSLVAAVAATVPAMGTNRLAVAEELDGMNGLVVASRSPGTTEPTGRPAYCCPVEAANDETDGPAVSRWSSRIEQVRLSRAVCAARVA